MLDTQGKANSRHKVQNFLKCLSYLTITVCPIFRVRMQRDILKKYFERLIDSVRVLRPHCHNFKANNFEHYCAVAHARHTMPQLMYRCTKYGTIDLFTRVLTQSCSMSLNEGSIVFECFGRIISKIYSEISHLK